MPSPLFIITVPLTNEEFRTIQEFHDREISNTNNCDRGRVEIIESVAASSKENQDNLLLTEYTDPIACACTDHSRSRTLYFEANRIGAENRTQIHSRNIATALVVDKFMNHLIYSCLCQKIMFQFNQLPLNPLKGTYQLLNLNGLSTSDLL